MENNVFIYDVENENSFAITTDGQVNLHYNGIPDWVYEGMFVYLIHSVQSSIGIELVLHSTMCHMDIGQGCVLVVAAQDVTLIHSCAHCHIVSCSHIQKLKKIVPNHSVIYI